MSMHPSSTSTRLTSVLAACDELLAAGIPFEEKDLEHVSTELRSQVLASLQCLQQLHNIQLGQASKKQISGDTISTDSLQPGTFIGRFQILQILGQGGFGTVYLASDTQLHRQVALKIPHLAALLDEDARKRFEHEARNASILDHPNIVPIYDSGTSGLVSYIASAYCPGCTLEYWQKSHEDNPPAYQEIVELLRTLASAIQHAHNRGVLHRDLKPANILLMNDGAGAVADSPLSSLTPKIADFGLSSKSHDVKADGQIAGTPGYMSPEAATGSSSEITTRTDVYGLGAILYQLLTGNPPGQSILHINLAESIELDSHKLRAVVPVDIAAICLKCLSIKPEDRYQTAQELADDLKRYQMRVPINARQISFNERLILSIRRRPMISALAGLAALLVLGLLALGLFHIQSTNSMLREVSASLDQTRDSNQRAEISRDASLEAINRFLTNVSEVNLQYTPQTENLRRDLLKTALQNLEKLVELESNHMPLQRQYAQARLRHAMMLQRQGDVTSAKGEYLAAIKKLEQLHHATPHEEVARFDLAAAHFNFGILLRSTGSGNSIEALVPAEDETKKAIELLQGLAKEKPKNSIYRRMLANCYENIGLIRNSMKQEAVAASSHRQAMTERELLISEFPDQQEIKAEYALSVLNLAIILSSQSHADMVLAGAAGNNFMFYPSWTILYQTSAGFAIQTHSILKSMQAYCLYHRAIHVYKQTTQAIPGDHRFRRYLGLTLKNTGTLLARNFQSNAKAEPYYAESITVYQSLIKDHPSVPLYQQEMIGTVQQATQAVVDSRDTKLIPNYLKSIDVALDGNKSHLSQATQTELKKMRDTLSQLNQK